MGRFDFSVNLRRPRDISNGYKSDLKHYGKNGRPWQVRPQGTGPQDWILTHFTSPIVWRNGNRLKGNFARANYIVLDVDKGATLNEAETLLDGYAYLIATTVSHQLPKKTNSGVISTPRDRYRVWIPLSEPIYDLAVYKYNIDLWVQRFHADDQAEDGARMFKPSVDIWSFKAEGRLAKVHEPKTVSPPRRRVAYPVVCESHKSIPLRARGLLDYGCSDGERNRSCFLIGLMMGSYGWSEDELVGLVMQSPIPIDRSVEDEVRKAVRSGMSCSRERRA